MSFFSKIGKALGSVAGPIVNGAFGIGTALLGSKSQSDANKANIQLAQMNNEFSERMMNKQMQYNTGVLNMQNRFAEKQAADANAFTEKMWNKTNEYNSAQAQAERLRAAGLNPALVMSGQNAGIAQGASGAQAATPSGNSIGLPSPSSAVVRPVNYDGFTSAIGNTISTLMAMRKQNNEIYNDNRSTDAVIAEARARIARQQEETRSVKFKNELNDITKDLQINHMNEDFLAKVQERSNMEEQQKLLQQQIIAQELINKNLPEKLSMELAVMASTRDLNKFNAKTTAEQLMDSIKKRGFKLSESEEKAIFDALIQTIHSNKFNGSSLTSILTSGLGQIGYIKGKQ